MKVRSVVVATLLTMGLVACGVENDPEIVEQIEQCIADGGEPQYVADRHGYILDYFGCT